jgi:SAM-dependent methyltransferase
MNRKKLKYRDSHKGRRKGIEYHNDYLTDNYKLFVWEWEKKVLLDILKKHVNKTADRYLDFACGTGRILTHMENYFPSSIGVDVSPSMLAEAKKHSAKSELILEDITAKDIFAPDSFSVITAFRFFRYAENDLRMKVFEKLHSILKNDGVLIFNNHMNRNSITDIVKRLYQKIKGIEGEAHPLSINGIKKRLDSVGFEIVDIYHYAVFPVIDDRTRMPLNLIKPFETLFSHIPIFRFISSNNIFVVKKTNYSTNI